MNLRALFAASLLATFSTACSSNLSRFDVINMNPSSGTQITRAETADQGSGKTNTGSANPAANHSLSRVTVGGFYMRSTASVAGGSSAAGGLYGNPKATR